MTYKRIFCRPPWLQWKWLMIAAQFSEAKPTGGSPGVFLRQPLGAARSAGVKECGARKRRIPLGVYIENARPQPGIFVAPRGIEPLFKV